MGSRPRGREAQEEVGEAEWEKDWMHLASLITEYYSSPGNSSLSEECLTSGSQREQNRRPDRRLGLWFGREVSGKEDVGASPCLLGSVSQRAASAEPKPRIRVITPQIISLKEAWGRNPPGGLGRHLQQVLPTPINVPQRTSSIIRTLLKG